MARDRTHPLLPLQYSTTEREYAGAARELNTIYWVELRYSFLGLGNTEGVINIIDGRL